MEKVSEEERDKPPSRGGAAVGVASVPLEERALWDSWQWQLAHAVRKAEDLRKYLVLSPEEEAVLRAVESVYPIMATPYYLSLIDPYDPDDPIRKQVIPSQEELGQRGTEDPLDEEADSPVPGLTHRYPDRVLMVVTNFCPVWCRHCTRKRLWKRHACKKAYTLRNLPDMIQYIRTHTEIRDVILSGGDPLTLPTPTLERIISQLRAIPHVEIIRIGTRVPVTLPQRLWDTELLSVFDRNGPIWVNTHFNHPKEITPEAARAVDNLLRAGVPVNNQSVLLAGVNDSVKVMRELVTGLLRIKVRPYYLYHCDPVQGAMHFRTSLEKGLEIMEGLRGHVSGLAVPTYVVDAPGGAGKIPVMPNYMVSWAEDGVVLRNYEGILVKYNPKGNGASGKPAPESVSDLLSEGGRLVPEGNPRMQRRRARQGRRL
ncbi:MAG: KamA family radical SAM protein [candidate division WOR-3 bacterium]